MPSSADRPRSWAAAEAGADLPRVGARGPRGRAGVSHQAMERLAGRGVGDDAELAFQHGRAAMVGADGAGPVTQVGLQLHEGAVADLLQGLKLDPAPGRLHRPGQVAARARATTSRSYSSTHWRSSCARASRIQSSYTPGSSSPRYAAIAAAACRRIPRCPRPPPRPAPPSALYRRRARPRGMSSRQPSTAPWTSPRARARRPAPGARDAVRGAGWSVPAHRSTQATAGRRSAAGPGGTRHARRGRRPGQQRATTGPGRYRPGRR